MNAVAHWVLGAGRLSVTVTVCLALAGLASWFTMSRQEDPSGLERWGQLVLVAPGWEVDQLERLVAMPLEQELYQIDSVVAVELSVRPGVVAGSVELAPSLASYADTWVEVRNALVVAQSRGPSELPVATVNEFITRTNAVVLAVEAPTMTQARQTARALRRAVQRVSDTGRVGLALDPGEVLDVRVDPDAVRQHALGLPVLAEQLRDALHDNAAGEIAPQTQRLWLSVPPTDDNVSSLVDLPIRTPHGLLVPLGALARVERTEQDPTDARGTYGMAPVILIGIESAAGANQVTWGQEIRRVVEEIRAADPNIAVHEVLFQPDNVRGRLDQLQASLLQSIGFLVVFLMLTMGPRLGLVVAGTVPAVVLVTVGLYAAGGGILHQISIAALVVALGLVVDNAIVLAEAVQRGRDEGLDGPTAALRAIRSLAFPLFAATGTTIAAFVPMLMASGDTAAFTGAIPTVVMLSLVVSLVLSVFVVPAVAMVVLRPRTGGSGQSSWLARGMRATAQFTATRPIRVLVVAVAVVVLAISQLGNLRTIFFPMSDRGSLVVDIALTEGTPVDVTYARVQPALRALQADADVDRFTAAVGETMPKFYYNIITTPQVPHRAQILVEPMPGTPRDALRDRLDQTISALLPDARVVVKPLSQGPPVGAPVEVRLIGQNQEALLQTAEAVRLWLAQQAGTDAVRHNAGPGLWTLRHDLDEAASADLGISRQQVAAVLATSGSGVPVAELRSGDEPVSVRLRTLGAPATTPAELEGLPLVAQTGAVVPMASVATMTPVLSPSVLHRRDQQRSLTVEAELLPGYTYADLLEPLRQTLPSLLAPGVSYQLGGEAEGSSDASTAILATAPLGVAMLLFFLLLEFRSFRRMGIILMAAPFAVAGVVPALLWTDQPFGFMPLLGILAVMGIVVNNAIVLVSVIDEGRATGMSTVQAIVWGVDLRWRAVLLTTGTTVGGLIPLAISDSPLWPAMATGMIGGIAVSALLTLVATPALYRLLLGAGVAEPTASLELGGDR